MKDFIKGLLICLLVLIFSGSTVYALTVLPGAQGGTGFGSATTTDIGKVLTVSSTSPLTWKISAIPTGVSTTTANTWTALNTFNGGLVWTNATGTSVTTTNLYVSTTASLPTTSFRGGLTFTSNSAIPSGSYAVGRDTAATPLLYFNAPSGSGMRWALNGTNFLTVNSSGQMTFTGNTGFLFNISSSGGSTGNPQFAIDDGVRTAEFTWSSAELYIGAYNNTPVHLRTNIGSAGGSGLDIAAGGNATFSKNLTVVGTTTLATTTISNVTISTGGSAGQAMCWKTTTTLGYCSTVVGVGGACTCN